MITPANGNAPSPPPVKRYSTVSLVPLNLNTTPHPADPVPTQLPVRPPNSVVPYRSPFAPMIRFDMGFAPSGPAKLCNTVSTPLVSNLNRAPHCHLPGQPSWLPPYLV